MKYSLGLTSSNFVVSIRDCFCRNTTMARRNYKKIFRRNCILSSVQEACRIYGKEEFNTCTCVQTVVHLRNSQKIQSIILIVTCFS